MEEMLYSVNEASQLLKCGKGFVYQLIKEGWLKAFKLGRIKVSRSAIVDLIKKLEDEELDITDLSDIKKLDSRYFDEKE